MRLIIGQAGAGKSTYLAGLIMQDKGDFMVLTATHASLDNIRKLCSAAKPAAKPAVPGDAFKTIFSFFRIDWVTGVMLGPKWFPERIYVDELSLVSGKLFARIVDMCLGRSELIVAGDPLQLNAPQEDEEFISFTDLKALKGYAPEVIEHYWLSPFRMMSGADTLWLTKNLRAGTKVMNILHAIFTKDETFPFEFIDEMDIVRLHMEGYTFLAGKYSILQRIYDTVREGGEGLAKPDQRSRPGAEPQTVETDGKFKRLHLLKGDLLIANESTDQVYNGEIVTFDRIEGGRVITSDGRRCGDVMPADICTIHKAQGRSIDKVVVCLDGLFDVAMLYTACTRARSELKFWGTKKQLFECSFVDELIQLKRLLRSHL